MILEFEDFLIRFLGFSGWILGDHVILYRFTAITLFAICTRTNRWTRFIWNSAHSMVSCRIVYAAERMLIGAYSKI